MNRTALLVALPMASSFPLVCLGASFLPDPRGTAAEDPIKITINPTTPTELDAVSVTLAGDLGEPYCGLDAMFFLYPDKDQIGIYLSSTAQVCDLLFRPSTFSFTEEIGLLPAGEYRAWSFSHQFDAVNNVELVTFEVSGDAEVGGIAELPQLERTGLEADSSDVHSGVLAGVVAAVAAGILALGGAAWFAWRRIPT